MIEKPCTFEHFPESAICPVCGTNEDAECILIQIDSTEKGNIAEAQPTHLWCAVAEQFNREVGVIYRRAKEGKQ